MNVGDKVVVHNPKFTDYFQLNGIDCNVEESEYYATVVSVNGKTGDVVVKIAETDSGPVTINTSTENVSLVP